MIIISMFGLMINTMKSKKKHSKTLNKKGYFALRAGRALRARPYLGHYVYLK